MRNILNPATQWQQQHPAGFVAARVSHRVWLSGGTGQPQAADVRDLCWLEKESMYAMPKVVWWLQHGLDCDDLQPPRCRSGKMPHERQPVAAWTDQAPQARAINQLIVQIVFAAPWCNNTGQAGLCLRLCCWFYSAAEPAGHRNRMSIKPQQVM